MDNWVPKNQSSPIAKLPICIYIYIHNHSSLYSKQKQSVVMENKANTVASLMSVKQKSGKTFGQIAEETGLTNVYVAQLLRRQAQLKPETAPKLKAALPHLSDEQLHAMMQAPLRSYDPNLVQDPTVYRLNEAVMHFGESIKEIINEEFGDGIMSAIDFFCSVDKVKGVDGKDRVVLTFDGKYLPHTEQKSEHMVSRLMRKE